jgi:excisionase family DNA binding protein
MSSTPQYLSIEQAAEYLNVTVRQVRNWIATRTIEHVKMGKYVRFRKEYLDQWVEKNTVKPLKKIA